MNEQKPQTIDELISETRRAEAERSQAESAAMMGVFSWKPTEYDSIDVDALSAKAFELQLKLSELAPLLADALTSARALLAQSETLARAMTLPEAWQNASCIDNHDQFCFHCGAEVPWPIGETNHTDACPVTLARALLAAMTTTEGGASHADG